MAKIVEFLAQLQLKATLYHETIEPIPVLQHFILSRPYKNILELDNLAISRSSGGGRFTPDPNKEFEPVPDVTIHGDRGTIMLGNIQKLIIEQK